MNKSVKIAMKITADYRYVYDPEHNSKPSGMWKMTGSGWSSNDADNAQPQKKIVHQTAPEEKNTSILDKAEKNEVEEVKEIKTTDDAENLFDGKPEESTFDTDDEGKEQEKEQTEEKDDGEELDFNMDDEEGGDAEKLDLDSEETTDEDDSDNQEDNGESPDLNDDDEESQEELNLDSEEGDKENTEEDKGIFDDSNKDEYVNEEKYDEYIEKLNSFIEKFDDGEGKENDVTFKAIASNLDWSKVDDVKAFAEHCEKKELEGADDVLAFLYFQHMNDEEKFEKIVEDMK